MEKKLWHLSKQEFACQKDAEAAWKQAIKGKHSFLTASCMYQEEGRYQQKGRPKNNTAPDYTVWHVVGTLTIDQNEVEAQIQKQASSIIATNVIEEQELSHEQEYVVYKEQGGVERGCAFPQRPTLLGLLRLCQKARTCDCLELYHGPLFIGVSLGRAKARALNLRQPNKPFLIR